MRNGNYTDKVAMYSEKVGSYRTYEEWKLSPSQAIALCNRRSYRTYEEWKPKFNIYVLETYF